MKIKCMSLYKNYFNEFINTSIVKKAIDKGIVDFEVIDLKSVDKKKRVDDKVVGGGKGNIFRYDVISDALDKYSSSKSSKILLSPCGISYNQELAKELASKEELVFVCPHFEGIDARINDEFDYIISIGDYILSGGEASCLVIMDSVIRLLNGVINKDSLLVESFNNNLLEHDQYALPREYKNKKIPDIYFSGNHKEIEKYNLNNSIEKTKKYRPDLYDKYINNK